jgi:sorbitol-specific phosphotransferase system component IIC
VAASGTVAWVGRAVSVLVFLIFVIRALMKLVGGAEVKEGIKHLGLAESMLTPLSILELACAVVYLIPPTSILGAILLTGCIGGGA